MPDALQKFVNDHPCLHFAIEHRATMACRLQVAKNEVAYYQLAVERSDCFQRVALRAALFDLMNSGISHRQFLKFVQEVERG